MPDDVTTVPGRARVAGRPASSPESLGGDGDGDDLGAEIAMEFADERRGGQESIASATKVTRPLYLAAIWFLGTTLMLGIVGWFVLAVLGRPAPDGLSVILGTVAGGLVTAVAGRVSSER